jgi:hypothetical protein
MYLSKDKFNSNFKSFTISLSTLTAHQVIASLASDELETSFASLNAVESIIVSSSKSSFSISFSSGTIHSFKTLSKYVFASCANSSQ